MNEIDVLLLPLKFRPVKTLNNRSAVSLADSIGLNVIDFAFSTAGSKGARNARSTSAAKSKTIQINFHL